MDTIKHLYTEIIPIDTLVSPEAIPSLANALVLAAGGKALDEALAIAHTLRTTTHTSAIRRTALDRQAAALREQLDLVEEARRRLAA